MYASELEHAIAYRCTNAPSLQTHPVTKEYVYITGNNIVCQNREDPHKQDFLRGHKSSILCMSLSPSNGTFIASGDDGAESDIIVWDFIEKRELWRFEEHDGGVKLVKFSHDERLLLSFGQTDNHLAIWDVKTGMLVAGADIPKTLGKVSDISWGGFVKDVKRRNTQRYKFATAGDTVCLWTLDPYSGTLEFEPASAGKVVRKSHCVAFTTLPDSCGRDNYVDEWILSGTASGDFCSYLIKPNVDGSVPSVTCASVTPVCSSGVVTICPDPKNGSVIAVGGGDGAVSVFGYRIRDSKWIDQEGFTVKGAAFGLTMSSDGKELIVGGSGGSLIRAVRGAMRDDNLFFISENHEGPITAVSFAPGSNEVFATTSTDGTVRVWNIVDYSMILMTYKGGPSRKHAASGNDYPTCLHFAVDALLTGWTDGIIRSHHATTGEVLWAIKDAHVGSVTALKLSHNMRFIVSGGVNGEVRVWEIRHRQLVSHLQEHSREVTSIVLFSNDSHAITTSKDRSFLCWDLKTDKRVACCVQPFGGIHSVTLSHDEAVILTVGQEGSLSLWDLRVPQPVIKIDNPDHGMHLTEATSIAMSHSGEIFATGGGDCVVKLWRLVNGRPSLIQDNIGHSSRINGLEFTLDDMQLVSVGEDGAIFIWNIFKD